MTLVSRCCCFVQVFQRGASAPKVESDSESDSHSDEERSREAVLVLVLGLRVRSAELGTVAEEGLRRKTAVCAGTATPDQEPQLFPGPSAAGAAAAPRRAPAAAVAGRPLLRQWTGAFEALSLLREPSRNAQEGGILSLHRLNESSWILACLEGV